MITVALWNASYRTVDIHRKDDHYNGIMPDIHESSATLNTVCKTVCKGNGKIEYSSEQLRALRHHGLHIRQCGRKVIFGARIWMLASERGQCQFLSLCCDLIASFPTDSDEQDIVISARNCVTVRPEINLNDASLHLHLSTQLFQRTLH